MVTILSRSHYILNKISKHQCFGKHLLIKRDDQNTLLGGLISGNKSRKLLYLSEMNPFPEVILSYGGIQSNSMSAIAQVVSNKSNNAHFYYFCKKVPQSLSSSPNGNFKKALNLGMKVGYLISETC